MSDQVAKRPKMDGGSRNGAQRKSTLPKKTADRCTQQFAAIVDTKAFVDKTLFIKAFLEAANSVIVTLAPRRIGKSTNMDMVRQFVSGNKKLFEDNKLKIYEEEREFFNENCKENPVIRLDLKSVGGSTEDVVLESLKCLIGGAYSNNQDLVTEDFEGNWTWANKKLKRVGITAEHFFVNYCENPKNLTKSDVIYGLKILSQCLHVYHGKPVYVFIDEYDAPIMSTIMTRYLADGVVNETINLINDVMSNFLKGNEHVKKALIIGCVRIMEVLPGDANDIKYYEFLREPEFAPYFGFTDREVEDLLERDEFVTFKTDEIQKWYNGYRLVHTNEYVIYSTYSILNYLRESSKKDKPMFVTYWVNSGYIPNMNELFAKVKIRKLIEDLMNDEEVEITIIPKKAKNEILTLKSLIHLQVDVLTVAHVHLFLQFLSENGYLNVVKYTTFTQPSTSVLRVPNEEIKKLLRRECYDVWLFNSKYQLDFRRSRDYVETLYLLLQQKDRDAFITFAKAVSNLFDGALIPNNEEEIHSILFTLVYNFQRYGVQNDLSVQRIKRRGRPPHLDIFIVLGDVGMIIEIKFKDESSEMAHTQILTQGYATVFDDYRNITVKIFLGLHMNEDRKVSLTYTIDESAIQTVTSDV